MPRRCSRRPRRRRRRGGTRRRRRSTGAASAIDPGDAVAAFNRANCLRGGRAGGGGGAGAGAGAEARSGVRGGLVQPRRAGGGARAARRRRAGISGGRSSSTPTMPTRSSTSRRSSSRPASWRRRGGGGSATWSSTRDSRVGADGGAGDPVRGPADGAGRRVTDFLFDGPEGARGDGAAGAWRRARRWIRAAMTAAARALAAEGLRVARFEFGYMAGRRQGRAQAAAAGGDGDAGVSRGGGGAGGAGRLVIGGKSMGGRVASMVADELGGRVAGLLCLGYPFHPPGRPEQLRTQAPGGAGDAGADRAGDARSVRDAGGGGGLSRCRRRSGCCGWRTATTTSGRARRCRGSPPPSTWRRWRGRWRSGRAGCRG